MVTTSQRLDGKSIRRLRWRPFLTERKEMPIIPLDVTRLQFLVAGESGGQRPDAQRMLDRSTQKPLWHPDVTVIGEGRAEIVQLSLSEGGFPKGLAERAIILPESIGAVSLGENGLSGKVGPAECRHPGRTGLGGVEA